MAKKKAQDKTLAQVVEKPAEKVKPETELSKLMERLTEKLKNEGQNYVPPAISESSPSYRDSLYSKIKEGSSFAYSMVINGFWIILEEQPYHDNPQKPWTRSINIIGYPCNGYKAGAWRVYDNLNWNVPWAAVEENYDKRGGFNNFEELVESLCK